MNSPFHKKMIDKNPIKQLHTVQRMVAAAKAADENFYKNIDPYEAEGNRLEASEPLAIDDPTSYDYDYDQNPETTAKKKTEVDSPLDYAYVSTAPHFQRLQDNIAAAFTPKKKSGPTSEDKKNQAEEAYWKSKTTTSEENNPFKNSESKLDDPNLLDTDVSYDPSKNYSGTFEESEEGNPYSIGQGVDKSKNIFNRFGQ